MIQQYLNILRRWVWLLVVAMLSSGTAAYIVTKNQPPTYEAQSRLIVGPGIDSINPDLNALRTGGQLMRTYAELATTRPVLESVVDELQIGLTSDLLKKMISVSTNEDTQILSVQVRGSDAAQVVVIANAVANKIVSLSPSGEGTSSNQVKSDLQVQIQEIKDSIDQNKVTIQEIEDRVVNTVSVEEKRLLFEQLSQVRVQQTDAQRILASLYESYQSSNTNQIKIIELAVTAEEADSHLLATTLMAAIAGIILTLTLVLGFEYFDDTIRTVGELAYAAGIPVLATIAKYKRLQGAGRERFIVHALPDSRAAESYRVLSSKLLLSRFQKEVANTLPHQQSKMLPEAEGGSATTKSTLQSVVISGTQADENVGEVAANLAVLLAQTGHRVILVDAYLHRPSIHRLFGIPEQRGLADILLLRNLAPKSVIRQLRTLATPFTDEGTEQDRYTMTQSALHERAALVSVDWVPGLQILPSGAQPTNPFELLVSPHMADLIQSLEKQADLVIIAASPLLSSADSLILASRANGVAIVARSGKTRRDTLKEIVNALNSLNANILGTILNHNQEGDLATPIKRSGTSPFSNRRDQQAQQSTVSA